MSKRFSLFKATTWRKTGLVLCLTVMGAWFPLVFAEDEILTIEGTKIRGNQELPTILYLVPWQNPEIQSITAPEQNFAVQRELKPLERSEFQRLMGYHEQFKGREAAESESKD